MKLIETHKQYASILPVIQSEHNIEVYRATALNNTPIFGVRRSYWPVEKHTVWFPTQKDVHASIKHGEIPL